MIDSSHRFIVIDSSHRLVVIEIAEEGGCHGDNLQLNKKLIGANGADLSCLKSAPLPLLSLLLPLPN